MSVTLTDDQRATLTVLTAKMTALGLGVRPVNEVVGGPVVSVYRFLPTGSTKVSHIESLSQDFAAALGAEDVVVKRIPGDTAVSLFVPNRERKYVKWIDVCQIPLNANGQRPNIPLLMGIDHLGRKVLDDLTTFPHLLIAGATGGGKSTWMKSELATIILNYSEDEIRLALSDTKGVEFTPFAKAPHCIELARSVDATLDLLDKLIDEMEKRLKLLGQTGEDTNIHEYNIRLIARGEASKRRLPYICLFIDEVFDLLGNKDRVETEGETRAPRVGEIAQRKLGKLAAKARATGIHVIASTQRPSVKLIEGDVKANFLGRLSFRLPSEGDSRTVLGTSGAEHLLARGDMLFINPNRPGVQRIHAPIATLDDIKACLEYAAIRRLG